MLSTCLWRATRSSCIVCVWSATRCNVREWSFDSTCSCASQPVAKIMNTNKIFNMIRVMCVSLQFLSCVSAAWHVCFTVHLFKTFLSLRSVRWAHAAIFSTFLQMQEYVEHLQSVTAQILLHVRFHLFPYVVFVVHTVIVVFFCWMRNLFVSHIWEKMIQSVSQILIHSDSDALLTILLKISWSLQIFSHFCLHLFNQLF